MGRDLAKFTQMINLALDFQTLVLMHLTTLIPSKSHFCAPIKMTQGYAGRRLTPELELVYV